ncbi:hypothetical protein CEXT_788931 [Caerostris extrusa]|uniref:Uncharacterized protein n=1 Tax=Caerostris extrusa TaxID=172846 RepID=A0AAV4MXH4_CAEEX|nr:hypothetical protein CEXT_788931 [Caerostris extrusa]
MSKTKNNKQLFKKKTLFKSSSQDIMIPSERELSCDRRVTGRKVQSGLSLENTARTERQGFSFSARGDVKNGAGRFQGARLGATG